MKLEPTISVRPPRPKDKDKVVKEEPIIKTNIFEILKNSRDNSGDEKLYK